MQPQAARLVARLGRRSPSTAAKRTTVSAQNMQFQLSQLLHVALSLLHADLLFQMSNSYRVTQQFVTNVPRPPKTLITGGLGQLGRSLSVLLRLASEYADCSKIIMF